MKTTRLIVLTLALVAVAFQAGVVAAASTTSLQVNASGASQPSVSTAVELRLPPTVAALDGRAYFDTNALEFIGVAPAAAGRAFAPVNISGGVAFGAFGLKSSGGSTVVRLIVAPKVAGDIKINVVVDATAGAQGVRLTSAPLYSSVALQSGTSVEGFAAPAPTAPVVPLRAPMTTRTLTGQRLLVPQDLDAAQAAWELSRLNGDACGAIDTAADANGDGCIDVVDVQAVVAGQGHSAALNPLVQQIAPAGQITSLSSLGRPSSANPATAAQPGKAAITYAHTFTVTYNGDTADANPGNGVCADSQGRCSLRAAMTESNWSHGADLINFNIPGTAPIQITVGSMLPLLNDQSGGTVIDGYTQPGSKVNSAQFGSNAVPGIAIEGTGNSPKTSIFYVTSAGNTIRGLALYRSWRAISLNSATATGNQIIGNWIGITPTGGVPSYRQEEGVYMDQGPSGNFIGTPALADRNVVGYGFKGIDSYGPGTNNNTIQNNVICMTPSGAAATCGTGVDHDFGPKGEQLGGFDTNEKNVIGPTLLNGVEISHGWDPDHQDTTTKWVNMNIHVEGNWIGFKIDGSYDAAYRSGQSKPSSNDANGVNIYDGCSDNVVDGNFIASVYDGVNTMVSNCFENVIQNNTIGVSPKGQNAPMNWWGVHVRQGTYGTLIKGNTIRNAALGGIGLETGNERTIKITQNIVTDTNGPAIFLQPASGSSAPGSNNLYAAPVITATSTSSVSGTGIAGSTVEVYQASRNAGQSGLPTAYLGSGTVQGDGTWTVTVSVANNTRVTALEIAPNGNTSQLGINVNVGSGSQVIKPVAKYTWLQRSGNRTVDFTDTSTNTPTTWKWTFGDGSTSTVQNPSHTYAAAGTFTVKLTATNSAGSSTKTKTITVT